MNMPLSKEERMYFDEKFNNISEKLKALVELSTRVTQLEIGIEKRPTTFQVIVACGFFLGLGVTLGAALF